MLERGLGLLGSRSDLDKCFSLSAVTTFGGVKVVWACSNFEKDILGIEVWPRIQSSPGEVLLGEERGK